MSMINRLLFLSVFLLPAFLTGQVSQEGWVTISVGQPAMQILLPANPTPQKQGLPPAVKTYIKKHEGFYLKDKPKGVVVTISATEYRDDIKADGRGVINGTNGQWQETGTKVAVLSTFDKKVSGKNGVQQRGVLLQNGDETEFIDLVITEGNRMWQVIVMADATQPALRPYLQQIVDSVRMMK